jgi:hypothetical protein
MDNKSFFTWGAGYAANNSTNNPWSSSTTASSAAGFGGSSSESNNVVGSVGGGEADQFTKLCSNIETMQISPSATTSSYPATSSSATSSSSVQASVSAPVPSSTPAPTGDGGGRSSFSSLGETQGSKYNVHEKVSLSADQ